MDIYAPAVLNRVVQDLKTVVPIPYLLNRYFPEVSISQQEAIFFDVLTGKPRLAPFVSPLVEGQIVQSQGYSTKSFSPAYIKDKRVLEDGKPIRRRAGQPISGALNPMEQRRAAIATETADQINMLYRRLEWMAAQVLRTGQVTVTGEKYPTTVVDFGRDAALTVTLTSTARWNDSAPVPLEDMEAWATLIKTKSGATTQDVIMAPNVWTTFRKNADVKELLEQNRYSPQTNIELGPTSPGDTMEYKGKVGNFNIFVYSGSYVDDNGATQQFLPNDYLLMPSVACEGVQHFGAIKDEAAGFQATDYYSKSWTVPDPAARFLLLQSAPLVVPYRVNATLAAKVQ